jgi:hypothetical protein
VHSVLGAELLSSGYSSTTQSSKGQNYGAGRGWIATAGFGWSRFQLSSLLFSVGKYFAYDGTVSHNGACQ